MEVIKFKPLLKVKDLKKYYPVRSGILQRIVAYVRAVDGVEFSIGETEAFGLVGETGCGKTTTGRLVIRLATPDSGSIVFKGVEIAKLPSRKLKWVRRETGIVFQDPTSSLNPRRTVYQTLLEPLKIHSEINDKKELNERILSLIEKVGLSEEHLRRYPHELSGGQRQRICIARALALNPKFLVLDEPTSSLDVSVQAQILNLLKELKSEFKMSYLFISHDLSVVRYMCDKIAVMYLGEIVETAEGKALFENPLHPYAKALLSSIPVPDPDYQGKRVMLREEIPSPINPPSGCRFRTRCNFSMKVCGEVAPEKVEVEPGHFVKCHLFSK